MSDVAVETQPVEFTEADIHGVIGFLQGGGWIKDFRGTDGRRFTRAVGRAIAFERSQKEEERCSSSS